MDRRENHERRAEPRNPKAGRIAWRPLYGNVDYTGWITDAASSSISFITASRLEPAFGDHIVLTNSRNKHHYQVARTAAYDERTSLIACQRVPEQLSHHRV